MHLSISDSAPLQLDVLSHPDENAKDGHPNNTRDDQAKLIGFTTEVSEQKPNEDIKEGWPFKVISQNENVSGTGAGIIDGSKTKTASKPKPQSLIPIPRIERRYFCQSCWCYVEQSQRRHDRMVHIPLRQAKCNNGKTSVSAQAPSLPCKSCGKEFKSKAGLSWHIKKMHRTEHDSMDTDENALTSKGNYFCYQCNTYVKECYIKHLMMHDEVRRIASSEKEINQPEFLKPVRPAAVINMEMKEWKQRRFIYLNPNNPARNGPDAMIICDTCPFAAFSTSRKYHEHCLIIHGRKTE